MACTVNLPISHLTFWFINLISNHLRMKTFWAKSIVALVLLFHWTNWRLLGQMENAFRDINSDSLVHLIVNPIPKLDALPSATCDDLELTKGIFTPAWWAEYGRWYESTKPCAIHYSSYSTGFLSSRHQVRKKSDGYVSCLGNNSIPYVPPGYNCSIQLGNMDDDKEWERLSTTINVSEENSMIEVNLAVFLEDPNHNICRQPRFRIRVYDQNQNIIPCGAYEVVAGSSLPGWGTSYCSPYKPVGYLPWTKMSIDLRKYLGQNITLEFQTMDCSEGAHSGFALFALRCQKSEITASAFCPNTSEMNLSAPEGFSGYQWSNGMTGKSITVNNPQPGQSYTVTLTPYSVINGNCQIQMTYTVPPLPEISFSGNPVSCPNASTALNAQVSQDGYTFTWSTGQAGDGISVNTPGLYTVTATNGVCTLDDSISVVESPLPNVVTSVLDAPCFGSTGQITVDPVDPGAGYSYQWSNGQTGPVQNLPAGQYTVTVTTTDGCSLTDNFTVGQPAQTVLSTSPDAYKCPDKSVTLEASGDFIGYLWSNGSQGSMINAANHGTYSVTATDAKGCTETHAIKVSDYPQPQVTLAAADTLVCPEANTILSVSVSPTQANSYNWSAGGPNGGGGAVNAGVYMVTVTDVNGCTGTDAVNIQEMVRQTVELTGPPFVCNGQSAAVGLHLQPGLLTGSAWFSSTTGQGTQTSVAQGMSEWLITLPNSGIIKLDSMELQGYDCPFPELPLDLAIDVDKIAADAQPVLLANGFPLLCPGDANAAINAVVENGLPPFVYAWSTGTSTAPVLSMLAAGAYKLTVTGANGCTATAGVSIVEPEQLIADLEVKPPPCFGENNGIITLQKRSGQGMLSIEINDAAPVSTQYPITSLAPGMYNLHVTDDFCAWDTSILFPTPPQYFISLVDTFVPMELPTPYRFKTITNAPLETIRYFPGNIMSDSSIRTPIATPVRNTWVTVEAYTPEGCLLTDRIFFQVTNSGLVYIPNVFWMGADGDNTVFFPGAREGAVEQMSLRIYDRWGALLFENHRLLPNDPRLGWDGRYQGQYVNEGVYIYDVKITYIDGMVERRTGDVLALRKR